MGQRAASSEQQAADGSGDGALCGVFGCLDAGGGRGAAAGGEPGCARGGRQAAARRAQPGAGHAARHLVSAWATAPRLVLGPGVGDSPSNEITAEPQQQRPRALTGCLVTSDALGCQRASAAQLLEQETTAKCGSKAKRLHAGGSHDYLLQVRAG